MSRVETQTNPARLRRSKSINLIERVFLDRPSVRKTLGRPGDTPIARQTTQKANSEFIQGANAFQANFFFFDKAQLGIIELA
jgi:hypothetical protein